MEFSGLDTTVPWAGDIRRARRDELDALAGIELDANQSLIEAGIDLPGGPTSTPRHLLDLSLAEGLLLVAAEAGDDRPVGFLAGAERHGALYIGELDVMRPWQRRGIGRKLVLAALTEARARRLWGAMLTTDRFVPFNAPFYASFGFHEVSPGQAPPSLADVLEAEIAGGADPKRRVAMIKRFG